MHLRNKFSSKNTNIITLDRPIQFIRDTLSNNQLFSIKSCMLVSASSQMKAVIFRKHKLIKD